jgi:hypothetical protein
MLRQVLPALPLRSRSGRPMPQGPIVELVIKTIIMIIMIIIIIIIIIPMRHDSSGMSLGIKCDITTPFRIISGLEGQQNALLNGPL